MLSSGCAIPDTAQAYSLNFAAIPRGPLGYMTVWPTGQDKPLVSTLNALTGTVTANAAIVPAGQQGAISVYPSNDTDLAIDVDGYFAPAEFGSGPLIDVQPDSMPGAGYAPELPARSAERLRSACCRVRAPCPARRLMF